ncbi:hypothetical protein M3A96_09885 [Helcobacillus massiliensis]|uniref:Uncharacterized protein n=1 Tax=Helcobacillus massiliensis TaxID=521392 RepID=A0A839QW44_9MICO|nr:hypothetical protein [Helcobacillus massiliensis]MBB3023915.1 hypothetical protein [Helcobacillus massiliensis]MCT1558421.1 hypothetical protein [Helcobacillus massiliensis]MCT2037031.1 hypothetical protein [Helcobacillus massiliensis]MCT2332724.1 hypothetical protein [Helcobacillus massiliensis]MDK7741584.1 hypothetical protein [Helcobacillus massiliensis]
MSTPARLGIYALILAAVFALSALLGSWLIPDSVVDDWTHSAAASAPVAAAPVGLTTPSAAEGAHHVR